MRDYFYTFATENFEVKAYIESETLDPADSFEFDEDIEAVRNGDVEWFSVTVEVLKNGHVVGTDHLGGCAYRTAAEFFDGHRDPDPMNRNCSLMRAERGDNVAICHYFPDMVREAIRDARQTLRP